MSYQTSTGDNGVFNLEVPPGSYSLAFGYVDRSYAFELWQNMSPWDYRPRDYMYRAPSRHSTLVQVIAHTTTGGIDAVIERGGAIYGSVLPAGVATVATPTDFANTTVDLMVFDD